METGRPESLRVAEDDMENRVIVTPGRWVRMGWELFKEDVGNFILAALIALALMSVGSFVVAGPLVAGMFQVAKRRMVEKRSDLMDLFAGFNQFIDAFLICILTGLFQLVGLALCIFPVFIVLAFYLFPYLFMIDRKLGFWDAMESSRTLATRDLVGFVLFVFLLVLLNFLGLLLLGVGVLVTFPVSVAAVAIAYKENVGFLSPQVEPVGPVRIP